MSNAFGGLGGKLAAAQVLIGRDVQGVMSRMSGGPAMRIFEAEEFETHFIPKVVESEPLSAGTTQNDLHFDGCTMIVKAVRKGNDLLDQISQWALDNYNTGVAVEKLKFSMTYIDRNAGATTPRRTITLFNATLMEPNNFASGGTFAKQMEGFTLHAPSFTRS